SEPSPLEILNALTRELQASLSLEGLLQLIADTTAQLLDIERASIRLVDDEARLVAVCRSGEPLHDNPQEPFQVGEGLIGWIAEHGEAARTGDAEQDPRFVRKPGMRASLRSFLGVPLMAEDECIGVVSAMSEERDFFSDRSEKLLTLLAGICAPYVRVARLSRVTDELRDLVVRDSLTGLFNHAYFQERLEHEIARSERTGRPVSLVFVDIDHFQAVNDSRGHPSGDLCLKVVAGLMLGQGRQSDVEFRLDASALAARYGGDELALILPDTPKAGAAALAERLRAQVEGHDFGELRLPPQTISAGVATYPGDGADRTELITSADRALTVAKRRGRNAVASYTSSLAPNGSPEGATQVEIEQLVALEQTLEQRAVAFAYQPIVAAGDERVIAYEALCQPALEAFAGPAELFHTAERAGRIVALGRICRELAADALDTMAEGPLLFVNLHPYELNDPQLADGSSGLEQWAHRVVFEITETAAIDDYDRLRRVISMLRQRGFRVALDDLGAGYAGLNSLALLQPDFVKLDMALIRNIHTRGSQLRLVRHLLEFCSGEGVQVIAEGVEIEQESSAVREMGCHLMQGHFFGEPRPPPRVSGQYVAPSRSRSEPPVEGSG
ncbi:MAG: EAL domain-containing protein, partial [Polyangiales bacterium]